MNLASSIFGENLTEALGWFLMHSLWQGLLIAGLLLLTLVLLKNRAAQLKYYVSFLALLILLAGSGISFYKALNHALEKQQLKDMMLYQPDMLSDYLTQSELGDAGKTSGQLIHPKRLLIKAELQNQFYWIVSLWIIGLLVYQIKLIGGLFYQNRILKRGLIHVDSRWTEKLYDYLSKLKISRQIKIFLSDRILSPLTIGFMKPLILLPVKLITNLSAKQIEAIIAHELAHIKRNDYLINIIQTFIETLFFFHPGVWYISSQIRDFREHACDDLALNLTGDKVSYAQALSLAQENMLMEGNLAVAFSGTRGSLLNRIKRLNKTITMKTNRTEKLFVAVILFTALISLSFLIDGSYAHMKQDADNLIGENVSNPTPENHKIIVIETQIDSTGNTVTTEKIYTSKETELDSLIALLSEHKTLNKESEKIIEVIMAEDDAIQSDEIKRNLHIALKSIEMEEIKLAMEEAKKAMEEEKVYLVMHDSILHTFRDSLNEHTFLIAKEALASAEEALNSMDYTIIVEDALQTAHEALSELDIELIVSEALESAEFEHDRQRRHVILKHGELEEVELLHDEYELTLQEKEEKLQRKLDELEDELKAVKKQLKEDKKQNK